MKTVILKVTVPDEAADDMVGAISDLPLLDKGYRVLKLLARESDEDEIRDTMNNGPGELRDRLMKTVKT